MILTVAHSCWSWKAVNIPNLVPRISRLLLGQGASPFLWFFLFGESKRKNGPLVSHGRWPRHTDTVSSLRVNHGDGWHCTLPANAAIKALNDKELDGRALRVNEARPREDRNGGRRNNRFPHSGGGNRW